VTRDFCLSCGGPLRLQPCSCGVTHPELEALQQREQAHLAEYAAARPLSPGDDRRLILTCAGPVTVREALSRLRHENAIREEPVRATPEGLVQLVYFQYRGTSLVKLPFQERP